MSGTCRRLRRNLTWTAGVVLLGVGGFAALLRWPHPLFPHRVEVGGLTLWSDAPFRPEDGRLVLEKAASKLASCTLADPAVHHDIFVCNTRWRRALLMAGAPGAGGACYDGIPHVFLSGAQVEENLLINRAGRPVAGERTLDYFIVHEIAHHLTWRSCRWLDYRRLPEWIREGYADYVARGSALARPGAVAAYLAGAEEMNQPARAPYLRYNLLVAHCLEVRRWTPARLLACRLPQAEMDAAVKAELALLFPSRT